MTQTLTIRPLQENELSQADYIFRLAFGTFIGLENPLQFAGDCDYMNRWYTNPTGAIAAIKNDQLVGSNFVSHWGSVGGFGPLTIHPDYWDQDIASQLLEKTIEKLSQWQIQQICIFTFSNSPKHLGLYGKFGLFPRFLTAILSKSLLKTVQPFTASLYSQLTPEQQQQTLQESHQLTDKLYSGLDLSREIEIVQARQLGDTILLWDEQGLLSFAICHCGPGTEAGSHTCYVKFGAVRPGKNTGKGFEQLLEACESFSLNIGLSKLVAGVSTARENAYRCLLARGFRYERLGVALHNPNQPGYSYADAYVIDDGR